MSKEKQTETESPGQTETTVPLTEAGLPVLGLHDGVEFEDYRRAPGVNKSGLDDIAICPKLYDFKRKNPKPPTPAMMLGTALHTLVLEPEVFEFTYIQDQYAGSTKKEAREWREKMTADGKIVINTKSDKDKGMYGVSDWDRLHLMAESVWRNPIASALLEDARTELSFWWIDEETGKLCKGRADGLGDGHNLAMDLKTTKDASFSGFSRSVHDFRYDVQNAFYTDGLRSCGVPCDGFVFIAIEKEPPYLCACYTLPADWVRIGRIKYRRALATYAECKAAGQWPSLEPLRDLQIPSYARFEKIS